MPEEALIANRGEIACPNHPYARQSTSQLVSVYHHETVSALTFRWLSCRRVGADIPTGRIPGPGADLDVARHTAPDAILRLRFLSEPVVLPTAWRIQDPVHRPQRGASDAMGAKSARAVFRFEH